MEKPDSGNSTSNASGSKKSIKIDVILNDVKNLLKISQQMSTDARLDFKRKYGRILDLLSILVDVSALSSLAQYWNIALRCFELPTLDITPTIEEYATMLGLPIQKKSHVYLFYGQHVGDEKIASLLELKPEQLGKGGKEAFSLKWRFLEGYLKELAQQQRWVTFSRVLALAIYGLVLFPFVPNLIDRSAMDVFYRVEKYGINPVPAILAETFLSLQVCHQKQQGKLRCCAQLLYVWTMTHMYARNKITAKHEPLKGFFCIPLKSRTLAEWKHEFDHIDLRSFSLMCPWYNGDSVICSCGNFPNVPLMGPRGCVSYSPTLVLYQLKWTQNEVPKELLGGESFLYEEREDIKSRTIKIMTAWSDIREKGFNELGKRIVGKTKKYDAWREARRGYPSNPEPSFNNVNNPLTKVQMLDKIAVLEAQVEILQEKYEDEEIINDTLQNKNQKQEREIEHLKDECADAHEALRCVKRARKEKEDLLPKMEHQERMLVKARNEADKYKKLLAEAQKRVLELERGEAQRLM